jgi:hypothetical protein
MDESMLALIGTVDRALVDQGVNPEIVSDQDKILIATQYVETAALQEKMVMTVTPSEVHPIATVLGSSSAAS